MAERTFRFTTTGGAIIDVKFVPDALRPAHSPVRMKTIIGAQQVGVTYLNHDEVREWVELLLLMRAEEVTP